MDLLTENSVRPPECPPVAPYRFADIHRVIDHVREVTSPTTRIVFDITCLTKIHALALASALSQRPLGSRWVAAYTLPESYGHMTERTGSPHWRDVIIAPLQNVAEIGEEATSRGIVIPGHESDRLWAGLSECEPSAGSVIWGTSNGRPDIGEKSRRLNKPVLDWLKGRTPGPWADSTVEIFSSSPLRLAIEQEARKAASTKAPVFLLAFGPKPLVFASGFYLSTIYPSGGWFVYPKPTTYDANYSTGSGRTTFFRL